MLLSFKVLTQKKGKRKKGLNLTDDPQQINILCLICKLKTTESGPTILDTQYDLSFIVDDGCGDRLSVQRDQYLSAYLHNI